MKISRHGLSVGIERVDDQFFLSLKAVGTLTHGDYQKITPMIDSALKEVKEPEVLALIDARELEGWELRAGWDDFKLGLKHGNKFDKVAMLGNQKWQDFASQIATWFISGDVKYFEDEQEAIAWLKE